MRKILVVDDLPTHRFLLAGLLSHCQCEVLTASNGPAALALTEQFHPDVVFLDITMPEMDGYELARRLRDDPEMKDAKLVAISAWDCDQAKLTQVGINQYLRKPVMLRDVCNAGEVPC